VSILGAHAAVKTYAFACSEEGSSNGPDSLVLLPLLAPHTKLLGRCWIGLLRDYTAIRTQWATKMQPRYEPFLDGVQLAAVAEVVLPHLTECWPVVLEAVTIDVTPASQEDDVNGAGKALPIQAIEINDAEFKQIWALAILKSDPASNQLVALHALRALCAKDFYRPDMLSVDLCQELLQVFFI
jgi:hypothetical protein